MDGKEYWATFRRGLLMNTIILMTLLFSVGYFEGLHRSFVYWRDSFFHFGF